MGDWWKKRRLYLPLFYLFIYTLNLRETLKVESIREREREKGSISPTCLRSFFTKQDGKLFWRMAFCKQQINLTKITLHIEQISLEQNVGEIEEQFFYQMLCAGNFLLGTQRYDEIDPFNSSMFHARIFCMKVLRTAFFSYISAL